MKKKVEEEKGMESEMENEIGEESEKEEGEGLEEIHFGTLGFVALGVYGKWMVDIAIGLSQICFTATYLVFAGKNLSSVITSLNGCQEVISSTAFIWILFPLIAPMTFLRQLSNLAWAIWTADFFIIAGLLYLYIFNISRLLSFGVAEGIVLADPVGFWTFLGTAIFALEGTAFVLPIERAMKNKNHFTIITIVSSLSVGFVYMSFGLITYLTFGASTESIITLNVKNIDPHNPAIIILQVAYSIALLLTFPVQMFPAAKIIESYFFEHEPKSSLLTSKKNALRIVLSCVSGLLATIGGSSFDNFVSLVGGLFCVPLTFTFPALFHLLIVGKDPNFSYRDKWIDYLIIALGCSASIACTVVSIYYWVVGNRTEAVGCTL